MKNHGARGFTLLEMMIALAAMTFILLGTFAISNTVSQNAEVTALLTKLDLDAGRALDQLSAELMQGGLSTLTPPAAGDSTISYRRCTGYAGGNLVWGPQVTIQLESEPEDPDDGVDNDGDGLVDEQQIVHVTNPGAGNEVRVVLAKGLSEFAAGEVEDGADNDGDRVIDERGLSFQLDGKTLTIEVSTTGWSDATGTLVQSLSTAITFRN